jgi:hypothetical protein
MTHLERLAIEATINSEYQDGYEPAHFIDHRVWAWSVSDGLACAPQKRGGVIASCVKKGWLEYDGNFGESRDDDTIALTRAGVEAALAEGIKFPSMTTANRGDFK